VNVIRTGKCGKRCSTTSGAVCRRDAYQRDFMQAIAEGFINAAANARIKTSINVVALRVAAWRTGAGRLLRAGLEEEGFTVFAASQREPWGWWAELWQAWWGRRPEPPWQISAQKTPDFRVG